MTDHSQHQGSWQDDEANAYSIIECLGTPCPAGWDHGINWYNYRKTHPHYNYIQQNNKIGCASIDAGSGRRCNFCYLYKN